jgi:hypothetical protein
MAVLLFLWSFIARAQTNASTQNRLTVIVYDVHAHRFVPGIKINVFPLDAHNGQMAYFPSGQNTGQQTVTAFGKSYIKLARDATTDISGRATFDVDEMLQAVDRVNLELGQSTRKLITKHYEVYINLLTKGKYCTYAEKSLHRIMKAGIVGEITDPPCKTDVKANEFHPEPGEIVMFVTHAM